MRLTPPGQKTFVRELRDISVPRIWMLAASAATVLLLAIGGARPSAHTKISQVTWAVDVGPIIQSRCAQCHRPDGFAPIALTTFEEARKWSKAIRSEVLAGRMPPWQAARGYGDFANDASLTALEIELLTSWSDGGTPLGATAASAAPRTDETTRFQEKTFELPPVLVSGGSMSRSDVATNLTRDEWIAGWRFSPGVASLVEQATLWFGDTKVGAWTPIESEIQFPAGSAQLLARGARLAVDVRYRKSSEPKTDRSSLTLLVGSRPRVQLQHQSFACGTGVINNTIDLMAVLPHAAGAGESVEVVAREPDDAVEPIVVVPRFAPGSPATYRLRRPMRLRAGTRLTVRSSSAACSADVDFTTASRVSRQQVP